MGTGGNTTKGSASRVALDASRQARSSALGAVYDVVSQALPGELLTSDAKVITEWLTAVIDHGITRENRSAVDGYLRTWFGGQGEQVLTTAEKLLAPGRIQSQMAGASVSREEFALHQADDIDRAAMGERESTSDDATFDRTYDDIADEVRETGEVRTFVPPIRTAENEDGSTSRLRDKGENRAAVRHLIELQERHPDLDVKVTSLYDAAQGDVARILDLLPEDEADAWSLRMQQGSPREQRELPAQLLEEARTRYAITATPRADDIGRMGGDIGVFTQADLARVAMNKIGQKGVNKNSVDNPLVTGEHTALWVKLADGVRMPSTRAEANEQAADGKPVKGEYGIMTQREEDGSTWLRVSGQKLLQLAQSRIGGQGHKGRMNPTELWSAGMSALLTSGLIDAEADIRQVALTQNEQGERIGAKVKGADGKTRFRLEPAQLDAGYRVVGGSGGETGYRIAKAQAAAEKRGVKDPDRPLQPMEKWTDDIRSEETVLAELEQAQERVEAARTKATAAGAFGGTERRPYPAQAERLLSKYERAKRRVEFLEAELESIRAEQDAQASDAPVERMPFGEDDAPRDQARATTTRTVRTMTDPETGHELSITARETQVLSETEEMAEAAQAKFDATERMVDETTGEELSSTLPRRELVERQDKTVARAEQAERNAQRAQDEARRARRERVLVAVQKLDAAIAAPGGIELDPLGNVVTMGARAALEMHRLVGLIGYDKTKAALEAAVDQVRMKDAPHPGVFTSFTTLRQAQGALAELVRRADGLRLAPAQRKELNERRMVVMQTLFGTGRDLAAAKAEMGALATLVERLGRDQLDEHRAEQLVEQDAGQAAVREETRANRADEEGATDVPITPESAIRVFSALLDAFESIGETTAYERLTAYKDQNIRSPEGLAVLARARQYLASKIQHHETQVMDHETQAEVPSPLSDKQRAWIEDALKASARERKAQLGRMKPEQLDALYEAVQVYARDPELDIYTLGRIAALEDAISVALEPHGYNSMDGAPGATDPEQRAQAEAAVTKLVGEVEVKWQGLIKNNPAIAGFFRLYPNGREQIQIALHAMNPLTVAYHESMHAFFSRAQRSTDEAVKSMHDVLARVVMSPLVARQLAAKFAEKPLVLAAMGLAPNTQPPAEGTEAHNEIVHERLAYYFQLYANGELKPLSAARSALGKVMSFLRALVGLLDDAQKFDRVMAAFADGRMSTPNAMAQRYASIEAREKALGKLWDALKPARDALEPFVLPAVNTLAAYKSENMDWVRRQFYNEVTDRDRELGLLPAKDKAYNEYVNRWARSVEGATAEERTAAYDILIRAQQDIDTQGRVTETGVAKVDEIVTNTLAVLRDLYTYQHEAGVKRLVVTEGSIFWTELGYITGYFPRVWDFARIDADKARFVELLLQDKYRPELEALRAQFPDGTAMTIEQVAQALADQMSSTEAQVLEAPSDPNASRVELAEGEDRLGYVPWAQHVNVRALNWIDPTEFKEFFNTDLTNVMGTYIRQATHKAEYARRFGHDGGRLREKMGAELKQRGLEHYLKETGHDLAWWQNLTSEEKGRERSGTEFGAAMDKAAEELAPAARAVMAMEGTLGHDINPLLRKALGGVVVYQNLRLMALTLFANIMDVAGIAVRTGEARDAWLAFKRGMREIALQYKGEAGKDTTTRILEEIGAVEISTVLSSFGDLYAGDWMHGLAKRVNDKIFELNGMTAWNRGQRIYAGETALRDIPKLVERSREGDRTATRQLTELGLRQGDNILLPDGSLNYTDAHVQEAIVRWVNSAVLRPNAAHRPAKGSDPLYTPLYQFKQFTYSFSKVILKRLAHEYKMGNQAPIYKFAAIAMPVIIAADLARGTLTHGGDLPGYMDAYGPGDWLWHGIQRSGVLGYGQMGVDTVEDGVFGSLLGPSVDQVVDAFTEDPYTTVVKAAPFSTVIRPGML